MIKQDNDMISAKFIAFCGALLAIITISINFTLPAAAIAISVLNIKTKMNDMKYGISAFLLLVIAVRAVWLISSGEL